jgi:AP2 domain
MRKVHQKPEGVPNYRGVSWASSRGKWVGHLRVGGENLCLGYYSDPYIAACAYDRYRMEVVRLGWVLEGRSKTNAELGLIPPHTLEELRRIVPPTPERLWWIVHPNSTAPTPKEQEVIKASEDANNLPREPTPRRGQVGGPNRNWERYRKVSDAAKSQ